jgi:SAM-dependent methyltransferase
MLNQGERALLKTSSLKMEESALGIDWVVRQVLKNLLMHLEPFVYLRKRLFSRQNDPRSMIGGYFDFQWQTYRDAIESLHLVVDATNTLELGPGPILANGVRFIAEGAASYTALDRFDLLRDDREVRRVYRELIGQLSCEQQQRCQGLIADDDAGRKLFDSRIQSVVAKIEDSSEKIGIGHFDLAVSFDVLEHVDDLVATMRSIRSLLKPGGIMIHRVDVSIHGADTDVHRLAHLVFSERAWRMISSKRALCNRNRPSEFIAAAEALGFETLLFQPTTRLAPEGVAAIRPRLSKEFAHCSFEDLAVLDFVWIARSPT